MRGPNPHRRRFLRTGALAALSLPLACSREATNAPDETGARCRDEGDRSEPELAGADDPYAALRGFCEGISAADESEFADRRARACAAMQRHDVDALIFEAGLNLRHFTGVRWWPSERPLLYALMADGRQAWTGPAFEALRLRESIGEGAALATWEEQANPYAACRELLAGMGLNRGRVGLDPNTRYFVADGIHQAFDGVRVVDGSPAIDAVRMVKTTSELARLRRANEATKAALKHVAPRIAVGMKESEAKVLIREAQEAAGLTSIWVLALFGPNAAFPHGTHEERTLQKGDLVLVDTGGDLHGFQSDITRTWAPAGASEEARRAWDTVLAAQTAGLERIRPGVTCGEVDAAAREVITKAGYGKGYEQFTHRLGHGIGIQGHEAPYLRMDNARVLEAGMTMSDEPGIYRPGEFGVRIEDIVAVTGDGAEVFGPRPSSLDSPFG